MISSSSCLSQRNHNFSKRFSYANADIRVEETEDGNGDADLINTWIQTKNTKPCGLPGEYILILPQFFTDTTNKYGSKGTISINIFLLNNSANK